MRDREIREGRRPPPDLPRRADASGEEAGYLAAGLDRHQVVQRLAPGGVAACDLVAADLQTGPLDQILVAVDPAYVLAAVEAGQQVVHVLAGQVDHRSEEHTSEL